MRGGGAGPLERRRGSRLLLPLLLVVAVYGVCYVGVDLRPAQPLRAPPARVQPQTPRAAVRQQTTPAAADAPAPAPSPSSADAAPELPPLLSRRTPAWDRLLEQGLYHADSGYPKLLPQRDSDRAELDFWEQRVLNEYRDGARNATQSAECECAPVTAHAPLRMPPQLQRHQAVPAEADHHGPGARMAAVCAWQSLAD
jgi:hypothetical protein